MAFRRSAIVSLVLGIAFAGTVATAAPQPITPRQLWEEILAAKGGRERLRAIHSLAVFEGPADRNQVSSVGTWLFAFPRAYFRWIADPSDTDPSPTAILVRRDASDRQTARNGKVTREPLPVYARDLLLFQELALVCEAEGFAPIPVALRREREGGKFDVLTVDLGQVRADVYVKAGKRLPSRVVLPVDDDIYFNSRVRHDSYFDDYAAFGGIQLPRSVSRVFRRNRARVSWRVDYQVNPGYPQDFFDRSPNPSLGPEAWNK